MASSSGGGGAERTLGLLIKLGQFLATLYLIVAMYNIGPHWILLVATLAIPLYGLFLLFRSPGRALRHHPLAYVRYRALAKARNWFRVDLAICATMAVVCLAFALVLLLGYFHERSANPFLLHAALAAFLLSLLYSLNSLLTIRQLHIGRVDFMAEKQNASSSISTTRASTQSPIGESANFATPPYPPSSHEGWPSKKPMPPSIQSPPSSLERQGPSLLEQLQTELASEYGKGGRWRHIPIGMEKDEADGEEEAEGEEAEERVERRVRVEQRRRSQSGMDLGEFGTREEKWRGGGGGANHRRNGGGQQFGGGGRGGTVPEGKMLPRLTVQRVDDGRSSSRIRGQWNDGNGTFGGGNGKKEDHLEGHPLPPASSSSSGNAGQRDDESAIRRTIERKRVRYETVASKSLVDVGKGGGEGGRKPAEGQKRTDFDVSIRPRTSPFRHSTELRLRDDRRPKVPHQVTEL